MMSLVYLHNIADIPCLLLLEELAPGVRMQRLSLSPLRVHIPSTFHPETPKWHRDNPQIYMNTRWIEFSVLITSNVDGVI